MVHSMRNVGDHLGAFFSFYPRNILKNMGLQDIVSVLETYRGREKTMRTIQYGLLFATPLASRNVKAAFEVISSQLGLSRVVLRLFDDLPMLQFSLSCGIGKKDEDDTVRTLQILNNVVDQLYFPVEHIAWLRDVKVLRGTSTGLWNISLLLWGISLCLNILRSLRRITLLKKRNKMSSLEEKKRIEAIYTAEWLTVIMQASDLLNALNWSSFRPWNKSFAAWQVGLFGLISSLIGFSKLLSAN
ncbi:Peroxisomal biogenesis factor 11 gamma [Halocaridina rubra]|uniref:Peroxisomal biogenesis factor 11 gamma n=1 Tax=Halocaridina rubra TaxID=373956 RepID=A0AAN9A8H3_HALRR